MTNLEPQSTTPPEDVPVILADGDGAHEAESTGALSNLLSGKQKAFAAAAITIILGVAAVITPYVTDPEWTSIITKVIAGVTVLGTTLGVYRVTNK